MVTDFDVSFLAWENIYFYFPGSVSANKACAKTAANDGIPDYVLVNDEDCSAAHEAVCSTNCCKLKRPHFQTCLLELLLYAKG